MPKLVDLDVHEVSGVSRAANRRKFLIVKRDEEETLLEYLKSLPQRIAKSLRDLLNGAGAESVTGAEEDNAGAEEVSEPVTRATTKTEDGREYPAEAYAYVPDPEKPSTWKLRLWETPELKVTARQIGRALAALGPGFRGQKVQLPPEAVPAVKAKVLAAWKEVHPGAKPEEVPPILRSEEDLETVAKAGRVLSEVNLKRLQQALAVLQELIQQVAPPNPPETMMTKGDDGKMTLEEILAKLSTEEAEVVRKSMTQNAPLQANPSVEAELAALRKEAAERAAAMEELKKRAEEAEAIAKAEREERLKREYLLKAEALRSLPTKTDELAALLKALAEKVPEEAVKVEALLKAVNEALQESALFVEVGSSVPTGGAGTAYAQVQAKAAELVAKSAQPLTREQAVAKVLTENPELYERYLKEMEV